MKLKSLAVLTLLVFGCSFASSTSYTFGFASTGGGLYCDYEQFNNNSPFGPYLWQGVDNLSVCGVAYNATLVGVSATIPKSAGLPLSGKGVFFADNIYDAFSPPFTGYQWAYFSLLKCSTKKYGWIGFAGSPSGNIFGDNYGYLSCKIPGKHTPTRGLMIGRK